MSRKAETAVTIVTHWRPHLDEMVAIVLENVYGTSGQRPDVVLVKDGLMQYLVTEGGLMALEALEREGAKYVGIAGSKLDDHGGKSRECAATLMAEDLGVRYHSELERLLKYTLRQDTRGGQIYDLGDLISAMHALYPNDPQNVFEIVEPVLHAEINEAVERGPKCKFGESHLEAIRLLRAELARQGESFDEKRGTLTARLDGYLLKRLKGANPFDVVDCFALLLRQKSERSATFAEAVVRAEITRQYDFHFVVGQAVEKAAKIVQVKHSGIPLDLWVVESAHEQAAKFAFYRGAAIVVKRDPTTGHTQILYSKERTRRPSWMGGMGQLFSLEQTAEALKLAEKQADGNGYWFYDSKGDRIFNGSLTYPDVTATILSLTLIEEILKKVLGLKTSE